MSLFNVYPRFDVTLEKGIGCNVFDERGTKYLDLYGGHGVISIGHNHPAFLSALSEQMKKLCFYSNSVNLPIQEELAKELTHTCGYDAYNLFLCNSGSEANENALKIASFHNGRKKVIAFNNSFHGRTAASLNVTFNKKISSPLSSDDFETVFVQLGDLEKIEKHLKKEDICAVIVEGIQGVGGLDEPSPNFLTELSIQCKKYGTLLILDEIQSGFGRSGRFFAHQITKVEPDLITMAKGMGNGFPVGGVLVHPGVEAWYGMLGSTFGGNPLACAATLSVIKTLQTGNMIKNAYKIGDKVRNQFAEIPEVTRVKGRGLMLGLELPYSIAELRKDLLYKHHIFTGSSANPNLIRILPPLSISETEMNQFVNSLKTLFNETIYSS